MPNTLIRSCNRCGDPPHAGRPCNNPKVKELFPLSAAVGLRFAYIDEARLTDVPGFDELKVLATLGKDRFDSLMKMVVETSAMFCCGHRKYPAEYEGKQDFEVLCFYAKDVEDFLAQERANAKT